ncbi:MAG: alginate lyase family protein [Legionellaceae bacterium]|nr:alginate lyase family protein [Legionellaceae bacterium]
MRKVVSDVRTCSTDHSSQDKFILKDKVFFSDNHVLFLNHAVRIEKDKFWNNPEQEKLWLYHLHYFDGLCAADRGQRNKAYLLLERWVDENPPFSGNGWEPYPLSLRIVNCIKYALCGNTLSERVKQSLYLQTRYLYTRCEYHLLGNHLFENLKALCFAGIFFESKEARKWFSKGLKGLKKEVAQQILADGGHFELSPMYHSIILEGLLDLACLFTVYANMEAFPWRNEIHNMLKWLQAMQRTPEQWSYFNDTANEMVSSPENLLRYARSLGYENIVSDSTIVALPFSGYYVYQSQKIKAILDIAPVGPDYLPGHAHADTLSFELVVDGSPVFVNLGTSCYGSSARRAFERSTKAHNTLEIDGKNSSETWGGFRVARRARAYLDSLIISEGSMQLTARHNGYTRLHKGLWHERKWCITEEDLMIDDYVNPCFGEAWAYLHLHPAAVVTDFDERKVLIMTENGGLIEVSCDTKFVLLHNEFAASFGDLKRTSSLKIEVNMVSGRSRTRIVW